jgi:hypothetical protein
MDENRIKVKHSFNEEGYFLTEAVLAGLRQSTNPVLGPNLTKLV